MRFRKHSKGLEGLENVNAKDIIIVFDILVLLSEIISFIGLIELCSCNIHNKIQIKEFRGNGCDCALKWVNLLRKFFVASTRTRNNQENTAVQRLCLRRKTSPFRRTINKSQKTEANLRSQSWVDNETSTD